MPKSNNLHYIGDLHNHCNLTYGHGDLKDAFDAAKEQLDFVSVTPHAMWPDIPDKYDPKIAWNINYHIEAFKRLRKSGWSKYLDMMREYNKEGGFVVFNSYECHSMQYGDHVVLNYEMDAPLVECTSIEDLKNKLKDKKAFVTPHHMGYQEGYRGYNWDFFNPESTPFVEMYSRHGLAETDEGDYPYLHDMGPRNWKGSILYGLLKGNIFGIMGSTDQHAGYPGSYGDGRIILLSPSLSRDALWSALGNRKMYCITGDKILVDFRINDAEMGEVIRSNNRKIYINIQTCDSLDYIDIIKNGRRVGRINGDFLHAVPAEENIRAKVKVEFGWGKELIEWKGAIQITDGEIHNIQTCFRGSPYTSPQKGKEETFITKVNRVISKDSKEVVLHMFSENNPNTLTPQTQGVILDISFAKNANLVTDFNGKKWKCSMIELCSGAQSRFMNGLVSEAIQIHRAITYNSFAIEHYIEDNEPEKEIDFYYVRVRQKNNHWAWSTPIWVEKV